MRSAAIVAMALILHFSTVGGVATHGGSTQTGVHPPAGATHWVLHRGHAAGGRWYEILTIDAATGQMDVLHDGLRETVGLNDILAIVSRAAVRGGGPGRRLVIPPVASSHQGLNRFEIADDQGDSRTARPVVETVDGVRLLGSAVLPTEAHGGGDRAGRLRWNHDLLGSVSLELTSIARVRLQPGAAWPEPAGADGVQLDVVRLANGDVIAGFVDRWADPVVIETEDGRQVEVPVDRIGSIRFGNPVAAPSGCRVWLASGEVLPYVRLSSLDREAFRVVLAVASVNGGDLKDGRVYSLARSDVQAVVLNSGRFVGLADMAFLGAGLVGSEADASVSGPPMGTPALLDPGMPAGLSAVELHGPGVFRFVLPAGADRFACEVEVPAAARLWADLELVIQVGDREAYRAHITGRESAKVVVDEPLEAGDGTDRGELVVRIESAGMGPILDVVHLWFPRVLVGG